ncbi:MAG: DUF2177 family protein [Saprospiraceae bacterium]
MTRAIHAFFTMLLCIALDWCWLAVLGNNLLHFQPNAWFDATDLLFYSLFTSGILMFSIYPALYAHDRNIALYYGAVFGFTAFGLYEVISSLWYIYYPIDLAVADTIWGVISGALLGFLSYQLGRWMGMSGSRMKDLALDRGMFLE